GVGGFLSGVRGPGLPETCSRATEPSSVNSIRRQASADTDRASWSSAETITAGSSSKCRRANRAESEIASCSLSASSGSGTARDDDDMLTTDIHTPRVCALEPGRAGSPRIREVQSLGPALKAPGRY